VVRQEAIVKKELQLMAKGGRGTAAPEAFGLINALFVLVGLGA